MLYMNDYDRLAAARFFDTGRTPNRAYIVTVVDNLARWADCHSDGWAYWPKPVRAAERAMRLVASTTNAENEYRARVDATNAEVTAALRPIKAFLTRQGVAHGEVIPAR